MAGIYYPKNQKKYETNLSEEAKIRRRNQKNYSAAKSFIRLHATEEQLHDIIKLAKLKLEDFENEN